MILGTLNQNETNCFVWRMCRYVVVTSAQILGYLQALQVIRA